jgi:hypothetical protein
LIKINYFLASILLVIVAITFFLFLYETPSEFFKEFKNGLLGALVVILATGAIFCFQVSMEGDREKQNLIYEKKINFFQKVANVINKINTTEIIKPNNYLELKGLRNETILIGGKRSLEAFDQMLNILVYNKDKNIPVSPEIESAFEKLFREFRLELLQESGKASEEQKSIKNYLNELGNIEEIENRQEMEKKVFRTSEQKFEIIESFINIDPKNQNALKQLEKKYLIKNVKGRVKLFKNQLVKEDVYKEKLMLLGLGINKDDPVKIGSNYKNLIK